MPARFICETAVRGAGRLLFWSLLLLACLVMEPGLALSQARALDPPAEGAIGGRVLDTETLVPIEGARVSLVREVAGGAGRPRIVLTDSTGAYRFSGLSAARYRMLVERIGYLTRSLQVELREGQVAAVSVGLEIQPIRLPRVEVVGSAPQPFPRTRTPAAEVAGARARVARSRQAAHLPSDARELTHGDVLEAVTLAEPDLFRALQRVPGVATRDDYTATLWTRGSSWDQTRVYFDGLELYNPTHAGWLFSAVNADALGSVLFQPGYRSARWGEGTAAILDLRSRSGGAGEGVGGMAELSPASARLSLDGGVAGGQLRWMVAARRTYVDLLTRVLGALTADDELLIPYDFSDTVFRVDGEMEDGWGFEASSILERDHLRGDIPGIIRGNRGKWGNRAGQISLLVPVRLPGGDPLRGRISAGQTLFGTRVLADPQGEREGRAIRLPALENDVRHQTFGVAVAPSGADSLRWAAGYEVIRDAIRYVGPYSLLGILASVEGDSVLPTDYGDALLYSALWGERRWRLGGRVELETGMRVELGDSVFNGGRLRAAPRLAARTLLVPDALLSATWSRSYQYTQDVSPAAGPVGPQLHLSAIWLLATNSRFRPVARADMATVGVERWIGEEWLAAVNAYHRRTTGLLIPNPDTGVVRPGRDPDAVASNSAAGVELSLRRLTGWWTGSVGYAYGRSRMMSRVERATGEMVRYDFPAPADVPHTLDLTAMVRLGGGLRFGGAFTVGSGVPFTRLVLPDTARPPEDRDPPRLEGPYAARTAPYAGLDLMVEYSRAVGIWQVSAYGQLRNALDRENTVTYLGSRDGEGRISDNFQAGLPRLPLFGVRVTF